MLAWVKRALARGCIDELQKQQESEKKNWRSVLLRIVEVIKYLSECRLAFRGDDELIGSPNNGNFLGILELIERFDPVIADHIFTVWQARAKESELFILYINASGEPTEWFLKFLPICSHTGEELQDYVLDMLKELCLNVKDCIGQSYDNTANMSGKYAGLQARLKEINSLADYMPCAAYSLNLVGTASINCCLEAVNFLTESMNWWTTLTEGLTTNENGRVLTLKTLSWTRWHCHAESVRALFLNYGNFYNTLMNLADDKDAPAETRLTARTLANALRCLETTFMCDLWNRILQRFQNCSTLLQSTTTVAMFLSLENFMDQMRDQFEEVERAAKNIMPDVAQAYSAEGTRIRRPKRHADDSSSSEKFWVESFLTIIDQLTNNCLTNFAFLQAIADNNATQLRINVERIISRYPKDLDANCIDEFLYFLDFLSHLNVERSAQAIMRYEADLIKSTFPNVAVALRIFLTLSVMVCNIECSFLKMALIKNCLRSTLMQDKLNVESDVTRALNFESIMDTFATRKSRRKPF
uniref:Uncharacterized protein n=1 Tax=Latimeria chalumnae TaxID=7897 RepID=H3APK6_LATCH